MEKNSIRFEKSSPADTAANRISMIVLVSEAVEYLARWYPMKRIAMT